MPVQTSAVGQRIRSLRERQELSLRALAERCGLSINAISQIERGENSPTVSSLHQLATALGVSITDFFRDDAEQAAVFVADGARLRIDSHGVGMDSLGIGLPYQQLQPFLVTVAPGAGNADQPVAHAGEEFVFGLSGAIVYQVGEQRFRLAGGDSLLFDSSQPHHFHNETAAAASFLLVFLASGTQARQLHIESLRANGQDHAHAPDVTARQIGEKET